MRRNAALVPGHVRLAINKVRKALGIGQLGKLIAYTSVEQEHAWENLGITVSARSIKEGRGGARERSRFALLRAKKRCPACRSSLR